jgi:hypothetical protein
MAGTSVYTAFLISTVIAGSFGCFKYHHYSLKQETNQPRQHKKEEVFRLPLKTVSPVKNDKDLFSEVFITLQPSIVFPAPIFLDSGAHRHRLFAYIPEFPAVTALQALLKPPIRIPVNKQVASTPAATLKFPM